MISVFSASNRADNKTFPFASAYYNILRELTNDKVQLLDFRQLPSEFLHDMMYDSENQSPIIKNIHNQYLASTNKWVFFIPEYNGSFPGILKLFIDACSVNNLKDSFYGKKAAFVGIADGRSGNVKGMDHFTSVMNHIGTVVYPYKLPVSQISKLMDTELNITDQFTLTLFERHAKAFLEF